MPGMADGGNNDAASRAAVKSFMISDSSFIRAEGLIPRRLRRNEGY